MLTIVTHYNPNSGRDMTKCVESVKAALPPKRARHVLIPCESQEELVHARWKARELDEYIAFVDDDDYISQDVLIKCFGAIRVTGAGAAFCDEVLCKEDGEFIRNNNKIKTYEQISLFPLTMHNLCMMKTELLTDDVYENALKYDTTIEWFMKAKAGLTGGVIHVPIDGYFWVHHGEQRHKITTRQEQFRKALPDVQKILKSWAKYSGPIPQYKVVS